MSLSVIKREYIVTLKEHGDLGNFYDEMETSGSDGYCPDREVECISRRNTSRNTHYKLSELDVDKLKNHPNVINIELAPHERGIEATSLWGPQQGDFQKSTTFSSGDLNWGLKRVVDGVQTANWGTNGQTTFNDTIQTGSSGKNVDLVIVDSHVNHEHPEFWVNPTNNAAGSRMNQLDWFAEYAAALGDSYGTGKNYGYSSSGYGTPGQSNHGTHVAGTAGGNTQGWARDAHLYNIAFSTTLVNNASSTTYPDFAIYLFDYLREFHRKKPVNSKTGRKNPTVTNHSWGYSQGSPDLNSITSVTYRGKTTPVSGTDPERKVILEANGVPCPFNTTLYRVPVRVGAILADIQDAIADGIIVVSSAGNSYWLCDVDGGDDWNNYYSIGASNYYHSKGSSPGADANVVCVGAVGELVEEHKSTFSNIGARVDIWAPGSNIISSVFDTTASTEGYGTLVNDPRDSNFKLADIDGTSMSGPQVAGYIACVAEQEPNLTQDDVRQHLIDYSKENQVADSAVDGWGEALYTTTGNHSWTCPVGVTTVAVLVVGGGGEGGTANSADSTGGGGGALSFLNNIPVVPGTSYSLTVGAGGDGASGYDANGNNGGHSAFTYGNSNQFQVLAWGGNGGGGGAGSPGAGGAPASGGGTYFSDGGGNGGNGGGSNPAQGGGGGAGGYSGNGGQGLGSYPGSSAGGAGGGGGGGYQAGGGGVGVYGEGASGGPSNSGNNGLGGSGGESVTSSGGGTYGGGGGSSSGKGGDGAVRIVWWGPNSSQRAFPTTNVTQTTIWSQDYKNLGPGTNNRYLYFQKSRPDDGLVYPHETFKSRSISTTKYPRQRNVITKTEQFPDAYQWVFYVTAANGRYVFASSFDRNGTIPTHNTTQGGRNSITVTQGDTIEIHASDALHPFWISNRQGTGIPSPSETPSGISNNGSSSAAIIWNTAGITPGTYWYNCQYHSSMWGNIVITS